ncbi:MAG TPA: hypothetical protein VFV92_15655, partial [Candidatus Bathyarchaeia archaeon]|nr:hypothetical protein [Candidatus Bathyarchaeia archaeon]
VASTCPGKHTLPHVPAPGLVGRPGPRRVGTVAQTVIAQIVLPTCSSYDHDTFPEYGVCSQKPRSWSRNTGLSSLNNSA